MAMLDKILFLGTSSACPSSWRNTSSIAVRLNTGKTALMDCGEATQHQFFKPYCPLKMSKLDLILITHLHGDHVFGIFGLLATLGTMNRGTGVTVVGPKGIRQLVEVAHQITQTYLSYEVNYIELEGEEAQELGPIFDGVSVTAVPLKHRIAAFGYILTEPTKPGALDAKRAMSLGVRGPQLGALKAGNDVTLADGTVIRSADCVGPSVPGRTMALLQDTCDSSLAVPYLSDVDLLIHEATYEHKLAEKAVEHGHSTSTMAAELANQVRAKRLVLTHFSNRYSPLCAKTASEGEEKEVADAVDGDGERGYVDVLIDEAKAINPHLEVIAAEDWLMIDATKSFSVSYVGKARPTV